MTEIKIKLRQTRLLEQLLRNVKENHQVAEVGTTVTIGNLHVRLTFNLGNTNKNFYYS